MAAYVTQRRREEQRRYSPGQRVEAFALEAAAWTRSGISEALKGTLAMFSLKMPQLAIPVRLMVFGRAQTPSLDAMLALMDREVVKKRLMVLCPFHQG